MYQKPGARLLIPFLTAACLMLSACGGEVLKSGTSFVLVGSDDGHNRAGVGIGGRVDMIGNCIGIDNEVTIWPPKTTVVSDTPLVINVPGLGNIGVGDHVEGGGVESPAANPPGGIDMPLRQRLQLLPEHVAAEPA